MTFSAHPHKTSPAHPPMTPTPIPVVTPTYGVSDKGDSSIREKTGWPMPALMQDDDRKLFSWFASKPDARLLVRQACSEIVQQENAK